MGIFKVIGIALADFFLFALQVLFAYFVGGKIDNILQSFQDFLINGRVTWHANGRALIDVVIVGGGFIFLLWIYECGLRHIPILGLSKQWTEYFLEHFERVIDCAIAVVALIIMYNGLAGDVASEVTGDPSTVTNVMDQVEFAFSLVVVCAKISIPTYRKIKNVAKTHRFDEMKNEQIEDSINDERCVFIEMKNSAGTESDDQGHFSGRMVMRKQRGRTWKRMRNNRWRR